jgi:hypothetical protein
MPFDDQTRSRLAQFVTEARELTSSEFAEQLRSIYGVSASGAIASVADLKDLDEEQRSIAHLLRERVDYLKESFSTEKDATFAPIDRLTREQAFTVLNRLAALRMAEKRGFIVEAVGGGYKSKGFQIYTQIAGSGLGDTYHRYRRYLFCLFDELALDLGALFDRRSPSGLMFPREPALTALFRLFNAPEIDSLWGEDETIGWIYQYYNDEAERKRMRKKSSTPRNSRELAVRNQFFTPRYIVEFLTDNTLGRIWYEMTAGQTQLTSQCRFLARRSTDSFLGPNESPKATGETINETLVPYRPLKDPRELRLMDPACGSMHFGLYAFDLLEVIYKEAWDLSTTGRIPPSEGLPALHESFATKEDFIRAIPKLIIELNIHGIDIDPRAVQIAVLSLWLRAQRSWQDQKLTSASRPIITRSHIVCAEPLAGNAEVVEQFAKTLQPKVVGQLLIRIYEIMLLAGEAGSLLKVEEQIAALVAEGKRQWLAGPADEQTLLFPAAARPKQTELAFDLAEISDETFWETLEHRIYAELKDFSEQGENGYSRRLFAEDAAHGFAFIDICRKQYDVVVMNPPFGEFSKQWKEYAPLAFPNSYNDILAAFVDRWLHRLVWRGRLGAITSRTCFFLSSFSDWRLNVIQSDSSLCLMADLGQGVMDNAMVEAAAYILERSSRPVITAFMRAIAERDRESCIQACLKAHNDEIEETRLFWVRQQAFRRLKNSPFAYWVNEEDLQKFAEPVDFEPSVGQVRQGLATGDDPRFVRAVWEVSPEDTQFVYYPIDGQAFCRFDDPIVQNYFARRSRGTPRWAFHVKSGASQPWYSPITLKINWHRDGAELRSFTDEKGKLRSRPQNVAFYYRPGFSWTRRATRFYPYVIAGNCIPSVSRYMAFPVQGREYEALGVAASRTASAFMRFYGEWFQRPNFLVDNVKILPWPELDDQSKEILQARISDEVRQRRLAYMNHEPFHEFLVPAQIRDLSDGGKALWFDPVSLIGEKAEQLIATAYEFDSSASVRIDRDLREALAFQKPTEASDEDDEDEEDSDFLLDYRAPAKAEALISYCIGCSFGRWDVRYGTGEKEPPELGDPLAPLPVCPPGMLQNEQLLPASETEVPKSYPLRISWSSVLVDDPGHPEDIEKRIGDVLCLIWRDQADSIELQTCQALSCKSLREYCSDPTGFFAHHLSRYTKSRRQAPIYWPLSTRSGSYTVWLYYPRLTEQTLHTVLADFLMPKLTDVGREIQRLRASNGPTQRLEELLDFQQELEELRSELESVIKLPYKPSVNDGVLISASPLWKVFRLPRWQKDLKSCWEELKRGDYDWAHLAYSIWPDRVKERCKHDKSIAISHDLEDLCAMDVPKKNSKKRKHLPSVTEGTILK